jgi:hypothetical protein
MTTPPRSDLNPYLAGFGVGLVLVVAFVVLGRGLSMIGGFSSLVGSILPAARGAAIPGAEGLPLMMGLGVLLGAGWSAWRRRPPCLAAPSAGDPLRRRVGVPLFAGLLMGLGAKIGGGCTSGQVLSGGALLGVGSWLFMGALFATAYAGAWFLRRQWT